MLCVIPQFPLMSVSFFATTAAWYSAWNKRTLASARIIFTLCSPLKSVVSVDFSSKSASEFEGRVIEMTSPWERYMFIMRCLVGFTQAFLCVCCKDHTENRKLIFFFPYRSLGILKVTARWPHAGSEELFTPGGQMHSHSSENGLSRNNPARYTFRLSPVLCSFFMSEGRTTSVWTVEAIWVPKRTSFRVNVHKKLVTGSCSIPKDHSLGRTMKALLSITQHSQLTLSHPVLPTCFPSLTFLLWKQAGDPVSAVQEIKLLLHRQALFPSCYRLCWAPVLTSVSVGCSAVLPWAPTVLCLPVLPTISPFLLCSQLFAKC